MQATRFTDIRRFGSIDSTNRYLLEEARRGAPEGVVAVADHQSAGRGRLGRRWEAPSEANLLASILLRPALPAASRHLATSVVALAAADAVEGCTGLIPGLKWPNDLLGSGGRKLAGVLADADLSPVGDRLTDGSGVGAIVVGIGLNVGWPVTDGDLPDHLRGLATSLDWETGKQVDRWSLLDALLAALEPRLASLGTTTGRAAQVADLRRRCTTLGAIVRVELAGRTFVGKAEELTDEGHLLVRTPQGATTVVAGDVVHLRPVG